jgi:hypothetical protein
MKQPPDIIYLQYYDEDGNPLNEVLDDDMTWCSDKINDDSDVEYIRKDIYDKRDEEIIKDVLVFDRNVGYEHLVPLLPEVSVGPISDMPPEKTEYVVLVYRFTRQISDYRCEYKFQHVRIE